MLEHEGRSVGVGVFSLLIFLCFITQTGCKPGRAPEIVLPSTMASGGEMGLVADPCAAVKRCIAVYLTPWCSACKAAVGFVQVLRERLAGQDGIGLKIVVGGDSYEKILEMAGTIGGNIYLDERQEFKRLLGIGPIPAWLVWDEERNILQRFAGVPRGGSNEELLSWFLDDQLKVGQYVK